MRYRWILRRRGDYRLFDKRRTASPGLMYLHGMEFLFVFCILCILSGIGCGDIHVHI